MKNHALRYLQGWAGFCALCFLLLAGAQSSAQSPAQSLPGSADTGRVQEQLPSPAIATPVPQFPLPGAEQDMGLPHEAEEGFILNGVHITGASVFSQYTLDDIYTDMIGQTVDFQSLDAITREITRLYRQNGYILSRAFLPEQEIEDGIVQIQVVEGYIGYVSLDHPAPETVLNRDYLRILQGFEQKITAMRPLHGPTLERHLLIMNDLGGINVQAILDQSPEPPDASVALILKIVDEKPDISLFLDNHGSRYIGPYQTGFSIGHTTPLFAFDHLNISTAFSLPLDELQHVSLRYRLPLSESGLGMIFRSSLSNTVPGYTLRELDVEGRAQYAGLDIYYPLIRSRSRSLQVSAGMDAKNVRTDILGTRISDDRIRALRFSMDYAASDQWRGINFLGLNIGKGLDILGSSSPDSQMLSRAQGRPDFTKVDFSASRQQFLPHGFQFDVRLAGQFTADPLLSSEQFGFGGAQMGRGYDPSEITGDRGVAASIQLAYNELPAPADMHLQPFVFYDIGRVWNIDTPDGINQSAASAGVGLNFSAQGKLYGHLILAAPLTRKAATPLYGEDNGLRALFQMTYKF